MVHDAAHEVSSEGHGAEVSRPGNRRMTRFSVFWVGGQGFSTLWEMSVGDPVEQQFHCCRTTAGRIIGQSEHRSIGTWRTRIGAHEASFPHFLGT
jgi:hypothetical protein